jgi:hypothetical protein
MHKFALAEEKYQHQINEYLAKNESLQDKVLICGGHCCLCTCNLNG